MKPETAIPDAQSASGIPIHCRGCELADVADLVPHPENPNKHSDEQIATLARIIRARGWRHPIIVSRLSGRIVAGHGRLLAAKVLQVAQVPIERQAFDSEDAEREFLLADNRLAELAERDNALLKDLLEQLDTGASDMELTGYTEEAIEELMNQTHQDREEGPVIYDQSVQMEPAKEFLVILLEPSEIEEAKEMLALKQVRRGGYKTGSPFDAVGNERCIRWGRVRDVICHTK